MSLFSVNFSGCYIQGNVLRSSRTSGLCSPWRGRWIGWWRTMCSMVC